MDWKNHGKTREKPSEYGDLYGKSPFLMEKSGISMSLDCFKGKSTRKRKTIIFGGKNHGFL
jgi:hypothetical protein